MLILMPIESEEVDVIGPVHVVRYVLNFEVMLW